MDNTREELERKKETLRELIRSRSQANCSSTYSSAADVRRESGIEELEEEIERLETQIRKQVR